MTETTIERAIRLALEAGFGRDSFGLYQPNRSVVDYDLTPVIETLIRLARNEALTDAIGVLEAHEIPVGNSAAGEMACEWTYAALKEIRDSIRAMKEEV